MFDGEGDNRRDFLKCMAWAGTGALFAFNGGVGSSIGLDAALAAPAVHHAQRLSPSCRSATAISASTSRPIPTPARPSAKLSPR